MSLPLRLIIGAMMISTHAGCVEERVVPVHPHRRVIVEREVIAPMPPPRFVEVVPVPRPGYVWARGYWRWDGREYVAIHGHWEAARHGYHYRHPHWEHGPDGWHFRVGVWVAG